VRPSCEKTDCFPKRQTNGNAQEQDGIGIRRYGGWMMKTKSPANAKHNRKRQSAIYNSVPYTGNKRHFMQ
jgi:hypothetical protein